MTSNTSATKVLDVFEALMKVGLEGATIDQLGQSSGHRYPSVRRALIALQRYGLAEERPNPGTKAKTWYLGTRLNQLATEYQLSALEAVKKIKDNYFYNTGQELSENE